MEIFSLIAGAALSIMVAYVIVRLAYTIYTNVMNGIRFRQLLEDKVRQFRLSRMLEALGFNVRQYVHKEAVLDIEKQMSRCGSCENTQTCDEQLASGSVSLDSIGYCKNEDSLVDLDNRLHKAADAKAPLH